MRLPTLNAKVDFMRYIYSMAQYSELGWDGVAATRFASNARE